MLVDPLPVAWSFDAIGTVWRVDTAEPLTGEVQQAVAARIERFDRDWSRFREDSLVSRIAREPGHHRLPDDAGPLLELYRELYSASAGRVSPLVGRALESLGYDASYRLTPTVTRAPVPAWSEVIAWDGEHLDTVAPVLLDVGAAGKGYLVDLVGDLLSELGVTQHVVDAGGDLRTRGVPLRVALEHPADPSKAIGVVELGGTAADGALCASASNRRAWGEGLHHVLDALTGEPTADVVASWAIAPTALLADGAATALFFDTDPRFFADHGISTVRMFSNGRVEHSPTFSGELFR
jgi:thiamine biosynthesis lipoprotein